MVSDVISIPLKPPSATIKSPVGSKTEFAFPLRHFIVDENNVLVRVAVEACSVRKWKYNPLVLVGPSGTGKSTLANCLATGWLDQHPHAKPVVLTAVDFARRYANAVDTNAVDEMRQQLRHADLLLIDDLHQIVGKQAAQIELIHTLDCLRDKQCCILVTLPKLQTEYEKLHPGLVSRLSSGLIVSMNTPGPTARHAILSCLFEFHRLQLEPDALELLTESIDGHVPHLNNIVIQLVAAEAGQSEIVSLNSVKSFLNQSDQSDGPSLSAICRTVGRHFNLSTKDLKGKSRRKSVVRARGVAMLLSRKLTDASLAEIGRLYCNRDHTTVLHGYNKTEAISRSDSEIRKAIDSISSALESG